ncbi:tyrosine-type recombinase/integrase [Candidatus Bathyarchaeota archaeon]|nr:tyrosine-type recombinase/integrase [Candidatus Bathyarchaeota archaeon]
MKNKEFTKAGIHKKRKVSEVPIFLDDRLWDELRAIINQSGWNYKTNMEKLRLRDRGLICLLVLTGLRISEALQLKKLQFRVYENKIVLANAQTVKHGLMRAKIIMPKKGKLATFTTAFQEWLSIVPNDEAYVFPRATSLRAGSFLWDRPLSTKRAYWIIKTTTGKFPHWFRAVCETIYGRIVFHNNAWKLKEFMGLKRLDSTTPYVQGSWEENEKEIYKV